MMMAGILGVLTAAALSGEVNPALSIELAQQTEAVYAPAFYDPAPVASATFTGYRLAAGNGYGIAGTAARAFSADFYNRIHVVPREIALGNVVTAQTREIALWNAYDTPVTLGAVSVANGDGIEATGPGALPLAFSALQERIWTVTVLAEGAPSIDSAITFTFTGFDGQTVQIVGQRLSAWVWPADWSKTVDESLAWLTDVQRALNGATTCIPARGEPRRSFEFDVLADKHERRQIEAVLFDWTARLWAFPILPEATPLPAALASGADRVSVATAGLDFNIGSLAMLWVDSRHYELFEVAAISPTEVVFARPTSQAWPRGTRLYPCRTARLSEAPSLRRLSDQVIRSRVRFDIDEPCDWPAIAPTTMYLGYPVLEDRTDESDDPTAMYPREVVTIDGDIGLVALDDFSGRVFGRQSHAWRLQGRAERAAHRSLLYWLQGRAQRVWVPSWTDDLDLLQPMTISSEVMVVAWAGVTRSLRQQAGRQHLRIELTSGEVFYRRVETSAEIDDTSEQLLLDAALGRAVTPAAVSRICWMALSMQDADRVDISHITDIDGLAKCRTSFVFDPGNEP
jgi:hypothetical protein